MMRYYIMMFFVFYLHCWFVLGGRKTRCAVANHKGNVPQRGKSKRSSNQEGEADCGQNLWIEIFHFNAYVDNNI